MMLVNVGGNCMVKMLLHLEGLVVLITSIALYGYFDFSWLLFIILLFAPDIAMLGYLLSNQAGAITYNLFHTYVTPAVVIVCGIAFSSSIVQAVGIIWFAHIGLDRMFGYGLKYVKHFKETHFGKV